MVNDSVYLPPPPRTPTHYPAGYGGTERKSREPNSVLMAIKRIAFGPHKYNADARCAPSTRLKPSPNAEIAEMRPKTTRPSM